MNYSRVLNTITNITEIESTVNLISTDSPIVDRDVLVRAVQILRAKKEEALILRDKEDMEYGR